MSTITVNLEIKKGRIWFTSEGIFEGKTHFKTKKKTFKEAREDLESQIVMFFKRLINKDVNIRQHTFKDFGKDKICEVSYKVTWTDEINKGLMSLEDFKNLLRSREAAKKQNRTIKIESMINKMEPLVSGKTQDESDAIREEGRRHLEAVEEQVTTRKKRKRRTKAEMEAFRKASPVKKKRKRRTKAEMEEARRMDGRSKN